MKLSLESSDDIANFYGSEEILKREMKTPEEKSAEIRKVSAGEIKKLARDIFRNETLNMALIGPFKENRKFLKMLKFR